MKKYNSIDAIKDLNLLGDLQELALDGNPLSSEKCYKKMVLSKILSLRQLDMKKVSVSANRYG
jgi:hypothetical protein